MIERAWSWFREFFAGAEPDTYDPPDPELAAYDHAVGELRVAGELRGHLASVVTSMTFPARQPLPWFVVVWKDGRKENPFEDYGPGWYTIRELDKGFFDHREPSVDQVKIVLGFRVRYRVEGAPVCFDYLRLPADQAATRWAELGLSDSDF